MLLFFIGVVQGVIAQISWLIDLKLEKITDKKLYFHATKSFKDIYSMNKRYLMYNFIILLCGAVLKFVLEPWMDNSHFIVLACLWCLAVTAVVVLVVPVSIYMATEIKHLSPEDDIGRQILLSDDVKMKKDAHTFYLREAIMGILTTVTIYMEVFYISPIIGSIIVVVGFFLFFFGMADLLQTEDYNSPEDNRHDMKMEINSLRTIHRNIVNFYKNKEFHDKSVAVLRENISNIKKGIKSFF